MYFPITDHLAIFVVILGIILMTLILEKRYPITRKLSPILLILIFSAIFSNLGLIAINSPFYGLLNRFAVPFAVCLVLFRMRLSDVKKAGLPMLVAFAIASVGTFVGAVVAGVALNPLLASVKEIGAEHSWKIAGPFTGTYIGGSLNLAALWEAFELGKVGEGALWGAANAADNLILFPLFFFMLIVPDRLARFYPVSRIWRTETSPEDLSFISQADVRFRPLDVVTLSFCGLCVMLLSGWLNAKVLAVYVIEGIPTILIVTTLALILAQFKFISRLEGSKELSNLAFYIFFAAIGASCDVMKAIKMAPVLLLFVVIIFCVHVVTVFGIGRLFRLDPKVLAVASMAAKAGPSTVVALTNAKDWGYLLIPGIAVALFGYAIGNYVGFVAAHLVRLIVS